MADSIERIADGLTGLAAVIRKHGTCAPAALDEIATRLRALSPAGGLERGCDWYEDEDTGSRIVDFDFVSDHSRQLSLILKANGEVAYAAYINGTRMNGDDAMTPEFYSAIRMLAASPQQEPGAVAVGLPNPNWCRTCGKHRNDRMALLCVDRIHPHNAETKPTTADESGPSGQTLAGAGGDGECPLCSAPVKIWRDHRDGRGNEYEYVAPRSAPVMAAGAPAAQKPLDESANNAGVATGSRNDSPSESVTRGSLPPLTTATSAGTTGDDSEDAARLDWCASNLTLWNGEKHVPATREHIDVARRAREV